MDAMFSNNLHIKNLQIKFSIFTLNSSYSFTVVEEFETASEEATTC